jgi:hypothetical protein
MQYLQSQPFSVGLASKKFSEGWDRIFAKKADADQDQSEKTKSTDSSTEQAKKSESQSRV